MAKTVSQKTAIFSQKHEKSQLCVNSFCYICNMDKDVKIIYSTDFSTIADSSLQGYCIHVVCTSGTGTFTYNKHRFDIHRHDALVISHPEDVVIGETSSDLKVEIVAAKAVYLYSLLPSVNYGVSGRISLYDNPVIPLSEEHARQLLKDFANLVERAADTCHAFYSEIVGSLAMAMIYDIYYFHSLVHDTKSTTDRKAYVVKGLVEMLEKGCSRQHREVAYYAEQLSVTPKYLTETIKRVTGNSVSFLIDRYTVAIIKEFLNNPKLSISQIAEIMCFSSLSYFSRYVTKHLGMSPVKYRETLSASSTEK